VSGQRKPYHLHVATEYGAYGDRPWRDAEPQYPGQPAARQPVPGEPVPGEPAPGDGTPGYQPPSGRHRPRPPASTAIGVAALVIGLIGLAISSVGVATELMPRTFTAGQQRQITDWEYGRGWRTLTAGKIFPASVGYQAPAVLDDSSLTLTAHRIGIARQSSCRGAADPAAAAVLDRDGCSAMLRATYADGSDSYVVTVGVAVLPSAAQAAAAAAQLTSAAPASGIAPGLRAVAFGGTPSAWFTNARRQLTGAFPAGTYVALYTVGYADARPREPIGKDSYTDQEMTSVGDGVAHAVLAQVGAPVPAPHCPGTPGC
jgi:hypothetical protein